MSSAASAFSAGVFTSAFLVKTGKDRFPYAYRRHIHAQPRAARLRKHAGDNLALILPHVGGCRSHGPGFQQVARHLVAEQAVVLCNSSKAPSICR